MLEGRVLLRGSQGDELRAPSAVLSADHNALYLPLGYEQGGRRKPGSAFAVIDARGGLSTTKDLGRISYEDLVAKRERVVLTHYAKRAPPALRPIVMAILAGMSVDRR